jgi:hypothetical protein
LVPNKDIELRIVEIVSTDEFTDDVGRRYPCDGYAVMSGECVKLAQGCAGTPPVPLSDPGV